MLKKSQTKIKSFDQIELLVQHWQRANSIGTIIITHGQGEHSDCYQRLIDGLSQTNWSFLAWDIRGHGRSEGKRGYAHSFEDYVNDFKIVLDFCKDRNEINKNRIVLLSHSMGGLIQAKYFLYEKVCLPIHGLVFSSPLFEVALKVPAVKDMGAQLLNKFIPELTLHNEIDNTQLTADTDVLSEFQKDPYRHHKISSGVYLGFKENFPLIAAKIDQIKIPTLFQLSELDSVVSTSKALELSKKVNSIYCKTIVYPNSHHEIYNDIERQIAFHDLSQFLNQFENQN